jgi:phosphoglycerate dehydrogenase-like enzyme
MRNSTIRFIAAGLALAVLVPLALARQDKNELPGSTRGSRVARVLPADAGERAKVSLTLIAGDLTDEQVKELGEVAPNVKIVRAKGRDEAMKLAPEADGVDGRWVSAEFLGKAKKLSWIHSPSAGVDRLVTVPGVRENKALVVTNARGVHGPAIADHAMAMLLSLTRQLPWYGDAQEKGTWTRDEPPTRGVALAGKTMLVVGIGGIGTEIARRAHGFDMRVIATRRSDAPSPEFVEHVGKPDELAAMLPKADVVAICVPLTKETERLFDEKMIGAMKRGSYLINIARGEGRGHAGAGGGVERRAAGGRGAGCDGPRAVARGARAVGVEERGDHAARRGGRGN